jgi:hypothetical protein
VKLHDYIWLLANIVAAVASLGCAIHLYRFSQKAKPAKPNVAMLIIGGTALITSLQFVFPEILSAFRRNREALLAGDWWAITMPN